MATGREEVAIEGAWGTLRGTLWLPETESSTALLIIAGSGPTDRYGNSRQGIQTQAYALLADELSEAGYAVLSYDKRGIGASYYHRPEEMLADCRFDHYVTDAALWVDYLRARGYERVVLLGHSEGALISLLMAQTEGRVEALISLCGPAMPIDQILKLQLGAQLIAYDYSLYASACRIIDTLKRGEEPTSVPQPLQGLFPAYLYRFYHEEMQHDPCRLISQARASLLVIGGEYDGQVPPAQAEALIKARPAARGVIIPRMSHVLKEASNPSVATQQALYNDPSLPLSEGLVEAIVEFLQSLK